MFCRESALSRRWSARKIHDNGFVDAAANIRLSVDRSESDIKIRSRKLAESLNRLKMTHDIQTPLLHFPYRDFLFIFHGLILANVKYLICDRDDREITQLQRATLDESFRVNLVVQITRDNVCDFMYRFISLYLSLSFIVDKLSINTFIRIVSLLLADARRQSITAI